MAKEQIFEVVFGAHGAEPTIRDEPGPIYRVRQRAMDFLRRAASAANERGNEDDAEKLDYCRVRLREALFGEMLGGLSIQFTNAAGERYHVTITPEGSDYRKAAAVVNGDEMPSVTWLAQYRSTNGRSLNQAPASGGRREQPKYGLPPADLPTEAERIGARMAQAARKAVEKR